MPWTCERCGRTFPKTGQSHSCASRSIADAFAGQGEKWRPLYEELKQRLEGRVGAFVEHCPSTGVMWKHTSTFGVVKFKRACMEVEFYSEGLRPERNPARWLQSSSNRVLHSVEVIDNRQFDDIIEWMVESYVLTRK